jgi:hypothetical protein
MHHLAAENSACVATQRVRPITVKGMIEIAPGQSDRLAAAARVEIRSARARADNLDHHHRMPP